MGNSAADSLMLLYAQAGYTTGSVSDRQRMLLDAGLGGSGGGSGADRMGVFTVYVAGASESAATKAVCDYVCDGVGDEVEINQAINAVSASLISFGTNGGNVVLVGRLFTIAGQVLRKSQVLVEGAYGEKGTVVKADSSWNPGSAVGMFGFADSSVQYTTLRDLCIDGNGKTVSAIYDIVGPGQQWDASHKYEDLYIKDPGGHGLYCGWTGSNPRNRSYTFDGIRIIDAGLEGFHADVADSFVNAVDVGSAGSFGINVLGSNNMLSNTKAWYSADSGFNIDGSRNQFSNCQAQDNTKHGFITSAAAGYAAFSNCQADSNSLGNPNVYDGFNIGAYNMLNGCFAFDKNESARGLNQKYGFNVAAAWAIVMITNCATWQNATGRINGTGAAGSIIANNVQW